MKTSITAALCLALLAAPGCKGDAKDQGPGDKQGEQQRGDGPRGGGPGDDGPGGDGPPFPPPGAVKAPAPPAVNELMRKVMGAFTSKNGELLKGFFPNRAQFLSVSDCDPADVVDRVVDGAAQTADRAAREGAGAIFHGFTRGYLLDVKKGEKPAECRAKMDVTIYLTKYDWTIGGQRQEGEAHFLRINDVWFIVKL